MVRGQHLSFVLHGGDGKYCRNRARTRTRTRCNTEVAASGRARGRARRTEDRGEQSGFLLTEACLRHHRRRCRKRKSISIHEGNGACVKTAAAAAELETETEASSSSSLFSEDESAEKRELLGAQSLLLPKTNSGGHIASWLFKLLLQGGPKTWRLLPATFLTFFGKFAGIYGAVLFKKAVDSVMEVGQSQSAVGGGQGPDGYKLAVLFLVTSGLLKALKSISSELRHVVFAPLSQQLSRFLALKIFHHLFSLDSSFHVKRQTGGVINIAERGIRAIMTFFRTSVLTLIPTMVEWSLVCGFVATKFSIGLAGVLVATFLAYSAWTVHWTQVSAMQRKEANQYDIKVSAKLADSLLNYETVVLSGNENAELKSFNKLLKQYQHFSLLNVYSSGTLNAGQGVIIAIGITCSLILTVMGCFQGTMSIGDIVLVQSLLLQLLEPLQFLGWYYSSLKNCFVDLEALLEILMTKSNLKDGSLDLPPQSTHRSRSSNSGGGGSSTGLSIAMENVDYSYQSDRQILKGLDLSIKPGESVAVVGSSGSGKSTLLRMILRLYDVDCGSVKIGSYPIKDLKLDSLRASMALIPQDTLMFNDTIYNNVRYGDLKATHEDVLEAIQSAQLGSLIDKLPKGHETVVGERGIKLSGGERQRIAIARAILRKPQILVCDEATSSLDSKTESEIMDTLRSVAKGRTCVFISHRLSTVQHCDQIHVLSEGKIVESGTHEELLKKSEKENGSLALYKKMWATQEKKPVDTRESHENVIYNN